MNRRKHWNQRRKRRLGQRQHRLLSGKRREAWRCWLERASRDKLCLSQFLVLPRMQKRVSLSLHTHPTCSLCSLLWPPSGPMVEQRCGPCKSLTALTNFMLEKSQTTRREAVPNKKSNQQVMEPEGIRAPRHPSDRSLETSLLPPTVFTHHIGRPLHH